MYVYNISKDNNNYASYKEHTYIGNILSAELTWLWFFNHVHVVI